MNKTDQTPEVSHSIRSETSTSSSRKQIVELQVNPNTWITEPGDSIKLSAMLLFTDGTKENVTLQALWQGLNEDDFTVVELADGTSHILLQTNTPSIIVQVRASLKGFDALSTGQVEGFEPTFQSSNTCMSDEDCRQTNCEDPADCVSSFECNSENRCVESSTATPDSVADTNHDRSATPTQPSESIEEPSIVRFQVAKWNENRDRFETINRRGNIVLKTANLLEIDGLNLGGIPCQGNRRETSITLKRDGAVIANFPHISILQSGCRTTDNTNFEWIKAVIGKNTDHITPGPAQLILSNGQHLDSIPLAVCLVLSEDDACQTPHPGSVMLFPPLPSPTTGSSTSSPEELGLPASNSSNTTSPSSLRNGSHSSTITPPLPQPGQSVPISSEHSLMITHLSAVEDPSRTFDGCTPPGTPGGVWTFGNLMRNITGGSEADAQALVMNWLQSWESDVSINGSVAPSRPSIRNRIIEPWLNRSGLNRSGGSGKLDLDLAPFRLLAIVNRMDLRAETPLSATQNPDDISLTSLGVPENAGEGRIVFGLLGPECESKEFTVIFEYALPAETVGDVIHWAKRWAHLSTLAFGPQYNRALEEIVSAFSGRALMPGQPNGSSLKQIRTNEIALKGPWELRQFNLDSHTGTLRPQGVTDTPDSSFNHSTDLFLMTLNAPVGQNIETSKFAASSLVNLIWDSPDFLTSDGRHNFALNTCSGCHSHETGTRFLHINPRDVGHQSKLSRFLTGGTVPDPVTGEGRDFNELERRKVDLEQFLSFPFPLNL